MGRADHEDAVHDGRHQRDDPGRDTEASNVRLSTSPKPDKKVNPTTVPMITVMARQLKYWRIPHKVRVRPRRVGRLAKAAHVLQNYEATAG
jgi:hypothetical protein